MTTTTAAAHWEGTIREGKGTMTPAHAPAIPFTRASRFESEPASNPEEVLGAALAGCFSMALSLALEQAGATPRSIATSARVQLDRDGQGFTITTIELTTEVSATGIDSGAFQQVAEATKKACPVSKALAGVKTMTLQATLR